MQRRTAVKSLAFLAAGIALLPACDKNTAAIHFKNFSLTTDQEKLVADIADTLIPKTDTPGALATGADRYVLKMLDECHPKKDQQDFLTGMQQFDGMAQNKYGASFSKCDKKQREQLCSAMETIGKNGQLFTFWKLIKYRTIEGYTTSKYVMTNQLVYELVPGRYNAHYPVKFLNANKKTA